MKSHRAPGMRIALPADGQGPSDAEQARLDWERARIEEAREEVRAGLVLEGEAAETWLRRWAAGEPLLEDEGAIDKAS